jgi:hypothetical protein
MVGHSLGRRGALGLGGVCRSRALLGQRHVVFDGTEAMVKKGGWRMSGVGFFREIGAGPMQIKQRPDGVMERMPMENHYRKFYKLR